MIYSKFPHCLYYGKIVIDKTFYVLFRQKAFLGRLYKNFSIVYFIAKQAMTFFYVLYRYNPFRDYKLYKHRFSLGFR